ncbi:putative SAM-depedendent methyltransferase [Tetraselmis virus 1]|uniref:Putative SAM-depedendent methyltransferase n=1 Tax=Tetraselmis virus 1 TaxID=2060617 RepID=A0A2P0VMU3_9VIRU|nr:putative SAM-depedendent methyltransferase [Tetraselmis virus 1]AUF82225.1 putative SAM-depedendent methyltransferase [Tetraselmis virus 1]
MSDKLFIELGGGGSERCRKRRFKQQDLRDVPGVDYVCKCWEIDGLIDENSVDGLYTRHMFEHLTFKQGEKSLQAWFKILKPGGSLEIILPNLEFHIQQLVQKRDIPGTSKKKGWKKHGIGGLFGWQGGELEEVWDVHKSGYDTSMLKETLEKAGFTTVVKNGPLDRDLHFIANKPRV